MSRGETQPKAQASSVLLGHPHTHPPGLSPGPDLNVDRGEAPSGPSPLAGPYSAGSLAVSVAVRRVNRKVALASCSWPSCCSEESEKDGFGREGALVTEAA